MEPLPPEVVIVELMVAVYDACDKVTGLDCVGVVVDDTWNDWVVL